MAEDIVKEEREEASDTELTLERIKAMFNADRDHSAEWRRQAEEDFDFVAGEQWTDEEKAYLEAAGRPVITFNRTSTIINAVAGSEIKNREEVRFQPVEEGDILANDFLTQIASWFRQKADADSVESEAFYDTLVCGMGWTRTTIDYEDDPDGAPRMDHIDPLEMFWDHNARKKCLADATRIWRVRRMTLAEAMEMFPDAPIENLDASEWVAWDSKVGATADDVHNYDGSAVEGHSLSGSDDNPFLKEVTLVHLEIRQTLERIRIIDPAGGDDIWLTEEEYEKLKERAEALGAPIPEGIPQKKVVYRQYWIGSDILDSADMPTDGFSYQCITGYRNHNEGVWHGLVHFMRDPQKWANKWLSQILHILNSMAKGGVMVEEGAVDDMDEFRRSWAKVDEVTFVQSLQGIAPKPHQSVPSQLFTMLEYAVNSIREVTGVNSEALGMRNAIQPIGLEKERKESSMTILSILFDAMRLYRRRQGRVMFELIKRYLADGRLIRIVGDTGAQYVPLMLKQDLKYDIYVDEAPQSPYIKEKVWSFVAPILPQLPPQITAELLEFAPIPASIAERIKEKLVALAQPDPLEQAEKQAEIQKKMVDAEMTQSAAMAKRAEAQERQAKALKEQADINLSVAKLATDILKETR